MNLTDISAKIAQKLNETQSIKAVYEYETGNPDGKYPMATVTAQGFDGEFASTAHNRRAFQFSIKVYQERQETSFGVAKAERVMREAVDEIITAFDMDTTLSGTVTYCAPVGADFSHEDREHDVRLANITLEAVTVVTAA